MSDEEDYEFEYSDQSDNEQQEGGVLVEAQNTYYEAKSMKGSDIASAKASFNCVISLETENSGVSGLSDYAFKAIKQMTKMYILAGDFASGLEPFRWVQHLSVPYMPGSYYPRALTHNLFPVQVNAGPNISQYFDSKLLGKINQLHLESRVQGVLRCSHS